MKAKGQDPDPAQEKAMYNEIKQRYDDQTSPYYAASRLWVDAIIDPAATRQVISLGIEAANNAPVERFNPGVIQV